jgi:enamine deaminase RidA (YjgF/YER057c/UK114 family)
LRSNSLERRLPTRSAPLIYVTDISRWREVASVHAERFGEIRPVTTMVEVSALIAPGLLVEIEADALVDP